MRFAYFEIRTTELTWQKDYAEALQTNYELACAQSMSVLHFDLKAVEDLTDGYARVIHAVVAYTPPLSPPKVEEPEGQKQKQPTSMRRRASDDYTPSPIKLGTPIGTPGDPSTYADLIVPGPLEFRVPSTYADLIAPAMRPMGTAPKDGTYIILFAPSGYSTTPNRCHVCRYDAEYRPLQPWVTYSNDSIADYGPEEPVGWLPLPIKKD